MGKSNITVSIETDLIFKVRQAGLNKSQICEEAFRAVLLERGEIENVGKALEETAAANDEEICKQIDAERLKFEQATEGNLDLRREALNFVRRKIPHNYDRGIRFELKYWTSTNQALEILKKEKEAPPAPPEENKSR